jgi:hypothetical protein
VTDETVFAEPVRAHRYWFLDTKKMHLFGMNGNAWDTGFLEARCLTWQHPAPHWVGPSSDDNERLFWLSLGAAGVMPGECMCGVNAYKLTTPVETDPSTMGKGKILVHGLVDLGGRVHEYERGYRAQYGLMVEAMILSQVPFGSNFSGYLEAKYECPFRVMTPADWKTEWEATYGRDRETVEEDQNTQATAGAGAPALTYAGSYAFAKSQGKTAAANRIVQAATATSQFTNVVDELTKSLDGPLTGCKCSICEGRRGKSWWSRNWFEIYMAFTVLAAAVLIVAALS